MLSALQLVVTIIALISFGFMMLVGLILLGSSVIGWIRTEIKRHKAINNIIDFGGNNERTKI